jgi:DNA modification methylase
MSPHYDHDGITIYHGDCLDILPQLGPVDHVVTDPPYGLMERDGKVQMRGAVASPDYGDWDRSCSFGWIGLVDVAHSITVFHDHKRATDVYVAGEAAGFALKQYLYWDKGDSGINPRRNFVNVVEQAVYMRRSSSSVWNGGGASVNIIRANRSPTPLHPTQKPVVVMRRIIEAVSNVGDLVLDPFMGSGTTLVAAKQLGRRAIGIEREETYCDIATRRLAQETLALFDVPVEREQMTVWGDAG